VEALRAATNVTGGFTDGCIIELGNRAAFQPDKHCGRHLSAGWRTHHLKRTRMLIQRAFRCWAGARYGNQWIAVRNILLVR